jgi:hypothetical protein
MDDGSTDVFGLLFCSRLIPTQTKPKKPKPAAAAIVIQVTEIIASPVELIFRYSGFPLKSNIEQRLGRSKILPGNTSTGV